MFAVSARLAAGIETNVWEFDDPAHYVYDPQLIAVTQSTARLLLQSEVLPFPLAEDASRILEAQTTNVVFDEPASLQLAGSVGSYATHGVFTSRILDGGAGNLWRQITVAADAPGVASDPMLSAYLAMDDDAWLDQVSGQPGTPTGSPTFATDAKVGTHAGRFPSNAYVRIAGDNPVHNRSAMTVAFWFKLISPTHLSPILGGNDSTGDQFVFRQIVSVLNYISITIQTTSGTMSMDTVPMPPTNVWTHLAVTWDGTATDKHLQIYLNGVLQFTSPSGYGGTIKSEGPIHFASDGISRHSNLTMDDFLMATRAYSAAEIAQVHAGRGTAFQPLGVQVRSGSDENHLRLRQFVGPDGTPRSAYHVGATRLGNSDHFDAGDRLVQYQAWFLTDRDRRETPRLRGVRFEGQLQDQRDSTSLDLTQGTQEGLTLMPGVNDAPYVGLAKRPNGGYYTNGVYLSRVFDAGSKVSWSRMDWKVTHEVPHNWAGLVGLWHLDQNWNDAQGGFRATIVSNVTYTPMAKIGIASAVFNGANAAAFAFGDLGSNACVAFWIENNALDDEVMRLTPEADVVITNRAIRVRGATPAADVTVFVNGSDRSAQLLSGWNHVVINFRGALNLANTMTVGYIPGAGYMHGKLDEMAIFKRELSAAEVSSLYVLGQREAAGRVRLQVSDATLTNFFGPNGLANNYFTIPPVPGENNLLGVLPQQRYFRYKIVLDGDGNGTPLARNISIATTGDAPVPRFDDNTLESLFSGTRVNAQSEVFGGLIGFDGVRTIGPANLRSTLPSIIGLWHFDEASWSGGGLAVQAEVGSSGEAHGDAHTSADAILGPAAGSFDGHGDFVDGLGSPLSIAGNDFTASAWFRSTATSPGTLFALNDLSRHFILQLNSDGASTAPGSLAFVVNDSTGPQTVATPAGMRLNDGHWHQVVGVRQGEQILLYVDGLRQAARTIPGLGNCGQQAMYIVGKHPVDGSHYAGVVDEVSIFGRALTETEIGDQSAGGYRAGIQGSYESEVLERLQATTWPRIQWAPLGSYGRPLSVPASPQDKLIGLWHLDEASGVVSNAVVANGLHGSTPSGATYRQTGRFDGALDLNAAVEQVVQIVHSPLLEPSPEALTIEAWVNLDAVENRTVLSKRSGGSGYQLYTDAAGRPVFWVGNAYTVGRIPLRALKWTHLAGVYDGTSLRLFVDGQPEATVASAGSLASGAPLTFGRNHNNANYMDGRLDEVAVHGRALPYGEVLDHYLAGAMFVGFQARTSATLPIMANFVGPARNTNAYYVAHEASVTETDLDPATYFQFSGRFESEDHRYSPAVRGVQVYASGYPIESATIYPVDGFAHPFSGHLMGFKADRLPISDTDIRFQLSGDSGPTPRWFYYDTTARRWTQEDTNGPNTYMFQTSSEAEVHTNIVSFYAQVYNQTGGLFRTRAFLHATLGEASPILDRVQVVASSGRINLLTPNGRENGDKSWLVSVPYDITWDYTTNVTGTIRIEISTDGGHVYQNLNPPALDVPITNRSHRWTTPATLTTQAVIRLISNTQADVWDVTDTPFTLQQGLQIVQHNGGAPTWYIGETNSIVWRRSFLAPPAYLDFSASGLFNGDEVRINPTPVGALAVNTYEWVTPMTNAGLVAEAGKLRVRQPTAPFYQDLSDAPFTLAGAVMLAPTNGQALRRGLPFDLTWASAGMGPEIQLEIQTAPATPWEIVSAAVSNATGVNHFLWTPTNSPTESARLRIRSLSDPRAQGLSEPFAVLPLLPGDPPLASHLTMDDDAWLDQVSGLLATPTGNPNFSTDAMVGTHAGLFPSNSYVRIAGVNPLQHSPAMTVAFWFKIISPTHLSPILGGSDSTGNPFVFRQVVSTENFISITVGTTQGNLVDDTVPMPPNNTWTHLAVTWDGTAADKHLQIYLNGVLQHTSANAFGGTIASAGPIHLASDGISRHSSLVMDDFRMSRQAMSADQILQVIGERLTVVSPNGSENGDQSWLVSAPYDITWNHTASVTGTVHIQYSGNGGASWLELAPPATAVPVTNRSYTWTTPSTTTTQALVRIISNVQTSAWDQSDAPFTLRQGLQLVQHNGGAPIWYLGETNRIVWRRSFLASPAHLEFSATGGFTGEQQRITFTTIGTQAINTFDWVTPFTNAALLSESARLRVIQPAGAAYADTSDAPFVMAGAVVTFPVYGHPVEHGQPIELTWLSAGMGPSVQLDLQATPDAPWNPIATAVTNATGVNHYWWTPTNAPTTSARLRLQSLSDPRAIGFSAPFELLPRVEHVVVHVSPLGAHRWPFATWEDAATNLADAVTAAHDGSTVLVSNGTYQLTQTVVITTPITVRGVFGREATTVDGGWPATTNRCFVLNHPDAVLEGLTIRNGHAPENNENPDSFAASGGGVWCLAGTVRHCWLSENVGGMGGGLFLRDGVVHDCVISNNVAFLIGGGVVLGAGSSGGLVERCLIVRNKVISTMGPVQTENVGGGAVCTEGSTLRNCIVTENEADHGGGVLLQIGGTMEASLIVANTAREKAGGVSVLNRATLRNSIIWSNMAPTNSNWLKDESIEVEPGSGEATIEHSCTVPLPTGTGNITNDPRLVSMGDLRYQLMPDSPCIDTGASLPAITNDFAAIPRPLDGDANGTAAWDMGAFEFIHATADSDGDGLSDSTEIYTVGSGATQADTDGDGMHDGAEMAADTDPRDAASALRITALERDALGVRINWAGGSAAWQILEYKTDLSATNEPWQPVLTVPPPTPLVNTTTDAGPTNPATSYRLRAVRP